MKFRCLVYIFLYILIYEVVCDGKDDEEENIIEKFEPTHEWKIVQKGQAIPKGLHVKINLQTGVTEAKLLDENEESKKNQALVKTTKEEDDVILDKTELKRALSNMPSDEILKPDEIKNIKDKYRTYEEIKQELGELQLTPRIDAEVLKILITQHKKEMAESDYDVYEILRILEDLDFLAHQFDNAIEFTNQDGFNGIIYKNLNSTSSIIKQASLKLFGSLVQNNAKVQIHALETGGISILLRLLSVEDESNVKMKAVSALSCLLRRFPLAQLKFLENGGLSVVSQLFEKDHIKIQVKLATLIGDLLIESNHALKDEYNFEQKQELIRQYKLVNLETNLLEYRWCQNLNKLLIKLIITDETDHDSIEKCLLSMHSIVLKCSSYYDPDVLVKLQYNYKHLALNDLGKSEELSNSDYFTNLNELCGELLRYSNSPKGSKEKIEL